MTRALAIAAGLALALSLAAGARAYDRPLELFLGDMTPAGSRDCMRSLLSELRSRDHERVNVTRVGAPSVRRMVGDEDGAFLDWTVDDLRPILERRRETPLDAIAIIDCRDVEASAEMLVLSPAGGLARVVLRQTPIDEERARWLGRTLLQHVWIGFDP